MPDKHSNIADAALQLCELGYKLVPLREKSKIPWLKEWQRNASDDPDVVLGWFEQRPGSNVGVVLGQASGIVDLEGDEDSSEADFVALFGGDPPACPTYKAHRGKHRLFRWRDDLPGGANVHIGALELRTGNGDKGAQSVFPPSIHQTGIRYEWLPMCSPMDIDPPDLPDYVVAKLWNMAGERQLTDEPERPKSERLKLYSQSQVLEGERDNVLYKEACALWNEQFRLHGTQAFERPDCQTTVHQRLLDANSARCRPPLEPELVLGKCDGARRFIMKEAMRGDDGARPLTTLGLEYRDGEWWPGVWRIESINSDPPEIRLFAPFLADFTPDGSITMPLEDFDVPGRVHKRIYAATRASVCLDDGARGWTRLWNGSYDKEQKRAKRGLKAKLSDHVKLVDAPEETKRAAFIAAAVAAYLERATSYNTENGAPPTGRPFRDGRGIWFRFDHMKSHIHMRYPEEKVTRIEISKCVREIGAKDHALQASGNDSRERWFCISVKCVSQLRRQHDPHQ